MNKIKLKGFDSEPATVDLTPTFEDATHMCLAMLENGTPEGKQKATAELLRYARELDRLARAAGSAFSPDDTPIEGE